MVAVLDTCTRTGEDTERDRFWQAWDEFFTALRQARAQSAREHSDGLTIAQYQLLIAVEEAGRTRCVDLAPTRGFLPWPGLPTGRRRLGAAPIT